MSRPIHVPTVIREVFRIYVDDAPILMPAAAVVCAVSSVLGTLLIGSGLALLALIIGVVAVTLFTGMVIELVAAARAGRRDVSAGHLLQEARPAFGELVLVEVAVSIAVGFVVAIGIDFVAALLVGGILSGGDSVVGIVVAVAIGLAVFGVPALFLQTVWSLAAPVVVLERPGGLRAMRRSRELVRGNRWKAFQVVVLLVIAIGVAITGVDFVVGVFAGSTARLLALVVLGIPSAPIPVLAQAVLYFHVRDASVDASADESHDRELAGL